MRTICLLSILLAGCVESMESHGVTAKQYSGGVPLVFTNASPETLCHLYLSDDLTEEYGDNWLPERGLPSGQSVELRVKPGTYKATWASCKDATDLKGHARVQTFASTRVHERAIVIKDPTQLYAFVPGTPPTKYASVRPHFRLERFEGHATVIEASLDAHARE